MISRDFYNNAVKAIRSGKADDEQWNAQSRVELTEIVKSASGGRYNISYSGNENYCNIRVRDKQTGKFVKSSQLSSIIKRYAAPLVKETSESAKGYSGEKVVPFVETQDHKKSWASILGRNAKRVVTAAATLALSAQLLLSGCGYFGLCKKEAPKNERPGRVPSQELRVESYQSPFVGHVALDGPRSYVESNRTGQIQLEVAEVNIPGLNLMRPPAPAIPVSSSVPVPAGNKKSSTKPSRPYKGPTNDDLDPDPIHAMMRRRAAHETLEQRSQRLEESREKQARENKANPFTPIYRYINNNVNNIEGSTDVKKSAELAWKDALSLGNDFVAFGTASYGSGSYKFLTEDDFKPDKAFKRVIRTLKEEGFRLQGGRIPGDEDYFSFGLGYAAQQQNLAVLLGAETANTVTFGLGNNIIYPALNVPRDLGGVVKKGIHTAFDVPRNAHLPNGPRQFNQAFWDTLSGLTYFIVNSATGQGFRNMEDMKKYRDDKSGAIRNLEFLGGAALEGFMIHEATQESHGKGNHITGDRDDGAGGANNGSEGGFSGGRGTGSGGG